MGIVYGDIGTSPLYAMQASLREAAPSTPRRGWGAVVDLLESRHLRHP